MEMALYLNALVALFVIIDPIGAALIFHALLSGDDEGYRRKMAFKAISISLVIMLSFGVYGEWLLLKLGISIDALKISGGLLLFYTAFQLITQPFSYRSGAAKVDISVFPMSIPLLAGPGCLTLSILLFAKPDSLWPVLLAVMTVYLVTLCCLLLSSQIKRLIGKTGDDILRRFLGVILAALSVQFVADGVRSFAI